LTISISVGQFLWSNFFNIRSSLRKDFADRLEQARLKIIADKYRPRLAQLYEEIQQSGVDFGNEALMAELTSTEFFGRIIALYEPLSERKALDDRLASLKRRGERVAGWGGVFVFTLPLSYFLFLWPVPISSNPSRVILLTLWLAVLVLAPFFLAAWNLALFWQERAQLDETLDSLRDS